jgi:hypothetical protein
MAVSVNMAVIWAVASSVLEVCTACITHHPDDGGSTNLRKVGKHILVYMALQPRSVDVFLNWHQSVCHGECLECE